MPQTGFLRTKKMKKNTAVSMDCFLDFHSNILMDISILKFWVLWQYPESTVVSEV